MLLIHLSVGDALMWTKYRREQLLCFGLLNLRWSMMFVVCCVCFCVWLYMRDTIVTTFVFIWAKPPKYTVKYAKNGYLWWKKEKEVDMKEEFLKLYNSWTKKLKTNGSIFWKRSNEINIYLYLLIEKNKFIRSSSR